MTHNKDAAERLGSLIERIRSAAKEADSNQVEALGGELNAIASELNDLWVLAILTVEAVEPVFSAQTGVGRSGELSVIDLCYNAFMIGRNGIPQTPEAARCDWFNDTFPLMRAGAERMLKETRRRMEYARADRDRRNELHREMNEEN